MSENILYCPECDTEYREGFTTCSDCGVSLVRQLDSEAGDTLVPLTREHSFELIAELLDRLEKAEVPYVVEAGTALALLDQQVIPVAAAQSWEARVFVAESRKERAVNILKEVLAQSREEKNRSGFNSPGGVFGGVEF